MGLGLAIKSFWAILASGTLPDNLLKDLKLRRDEPPKVIGPSKEELLKREAEQQARAIQLLTILQRDARLVDFLREDIKPYADAQVGAAVRNLHEGCQQVLQRYLNLEPVMNVPEGESVTVPAGFDPASIKLIGNVTGKPPLKGILRHRGWQTTKVDLPALPDSQGLMVIAPAEVEIL